MGRMLRERTGEVVASETTVRCRADQGGARARRALRLYERLGYERIRERHRAWSYTDPDGRLEHVEVDEVLLRKEL